MELLVFNYHLVFNLSNLDFNYLIRPFDLEVGDLRTKWLYLLSDFLNKFSALSLVELSGPSCNHLNELALTIENLSSYTSWYSLRSGRNIWTYCAIRHLNHFFPLRCGDDSSSCRYSNSSGSFLYAITALTCATRKIGAGSS